MIPSIQKRRLLFFIRSLTVVVFSFVLAACGLSMVAGSAFASPQELVVTEEDFAEERVYSPYAWS